MQYDAHFLFVFFNVCRAHGNGLNTVSASSMLNTGNNHHVLTPVPGDPSGRLVMTLLPSQGGGAGHDMMMHGGNGGGTMGLHGLHEQHHSGASSSSHSTRYNQGTALCTLLRNLKLLRNLNHQSSQGISSFSDKG